MCLLPPVERPTTEMYSIRSLNQEWWDARLCWTNAIPPLGRQPTSVEAEEYWRQCKLVPHQAWWLLNKYRRPTYLTCGQPLTDLPCLSHLANDAVHYPDGSTFYYRDLPGLGDPSYRLDKLLWTTSISLVAHEAWHAINQYVLGWESKTVRWDALWQAQKHLLPTIYVQTDKHEAFAEGGAIWGVYWNRPAQYPWPIDFWHYFNRLCIVERGWSFWSPMD